MVPRDLSYQHEFSVAPRRVGQTVYGTAHCGVLALQENLSSCGLVARNVFSPLFKNDRMGDRQILSIIH